MIKLSIVMEMCKLLSVPNVFNIPIFLSKLNQAFVAQASQITNWKDFWDLSRKQLFPTFAKAIDPPTKPFLVWIRGLINIPLEIIKNSTGEKNYQVHVSSYFEILKNTPLHAVFSALSSSEISKIMRMIKLHPECHVEMFLQRSFILWGTLV